jgi:release factor glutamine methyltransferase
MVVLRFSADLRSQQIFANGAELATIMGLDRDEHGTRIKGYPESKEQHVITLQDPILIKDTYRIGQLTPRIRDTVDRLFESPVRITEYDRTRMRFRQQDWPGVWGPSIDTLLFCQGLQKRENTSTRKVAEIGAGSGFLTQRVLETMPDVQEAWMVDIDPTATACQMELVTDARARCVTANGADFLSNARWDLVVCNPPYIPRPKSIDDNPYEGVDLLAYLLERCASYLAPGGKLVTNLSSLSEDLIAPIIARHELKTRVLAQHDVPLKVHNVLNNPEWTAYLEARGVRREWRRGYEYWQRLRIVEITP